MEIEYGTGTTSLNGKVYMPRNKKFTVRVQNNNHSIDGAVGTNNGTFSGISSYPLWIFDDNSANSSAFLRGSKPISIFFVVPKVSDMYFAIALTRSDVDTNSLFCGVKIPPSRASMTNRINSHRLSI